MIGLLAMTYSNSLEPPPEWAMLFHHSRENVYKGIDDDDDIVLPVLSPEWLDDMERQKHLNTTRPISDCPLLPETPITLLSDNSSRSSQDATRHPKPPQPPASEGVAKIVKASTGRDLSPKVTPRLLKAQGKTSANTNQNLSTAFDQAQDSQTFSPSPATSPHVTFDEILRIFHQSQTH